MDCPNCGHPNEEGAVFCASCGSPLPSTEVPPKATTPPLATPSSAGMVSGPGGGLAPLPDTVSLPPSSGLAKASLWLGIAGLVLIILTVVASVMFAYSMYEELERAGVIGEIERGIAPDPQELQEIFSESDLENLGGIGLGVVGCCLLSMLSAVLGLVLGIIGLSQESTQPTQRGRTYSIIGIVLGALPLLCCVGIFILNLLQGGRY
ncbi:MAG: zinc-ribbon domain-containing protein [Chloroflexia bacterium]|nr:zinc-ribbon domain-containing protein [Chloroflexia bacterium]